MTDLSHIHIFGTDIDGLAPDAKLVQTLYGHASIWEWSLDAEDNDRVLRVVSPSMTPQQISSLVQQHGYRCDELP